eukprot:TRINITY_DN28475_c0_g1_i1.p1 TRINITY_DN28475_c0_g1~~TRINITY_DN28475_c0_g1_i1.p1  ORF type:complete len:664 (-),score=104.73 TRINITY_DN28475_c0_g1_i1:170-2161(-)
MMRSYLAIAAAGFAVLVGVSLSDVRKLPTLMFWLTCALSLTALGLLLAVLIRRMVYCLGQDEQLRIQRFVGIEMRDGPAVVILNPLGYRGAMVQKAQELGTLEYARVKDTAKGLERIERGPKLLLLGPYDKVIRKEEAISLSSLDYVIVLDKLTGERRIEKGPSVFFPGPHDDARKDKGISLSKTEYIIVEDRLTGEQTTIKGPCIWFPEPNQECAAKKKTAMTLQEDEYVVLKDSCSGQRWLVKGKSLVFLEPTWSIEGGSAKKALVLKVNEYVRLVNSSSGKVTIHRGAMTVFPSPDEQVLDDGKQQAVEIDDEHAALVRDKSTGQLRLVTEKQLFVPGPNDTIEEVRELIKLEDHQAMIIKDKAGVYQYFYGSDERRSDGQPRSFFLPPNSEIVKMWWSRGPRRERKDVWFDRFDLRPHFMKFEFNCRTFDNVELILEGIHFWEIVDLPLMVRMTGDTSGDLVYHVRSQFILHVARVTLREFMDKLHTISKQVLEGDEAFYSARGIKVHSLEITRYQCADQSTSVILEQVIQETTNRMNRLSHAQSENEVNKFKMEGQIEQCRLSSELLEMQHKQAEDEAVVAGTSEANRALAFLTQLETQVPTLDQRIEMWKVLRKHDALSVVSQGGASLYYTPNDVDLSIESRKAADDISRKVPNGSA